MIDRYHFNAEVKFNAAYLDKHQWWLFHAVAFVGLYTEVWLINISLFRSLNDPGSMVYLRLHHGYTIPDLANYKLSNQRIGPFKIIEAVGKSKQAYRLEYPR